MQKFHPKRRGLHPNIPIKFVKELRERNLGEFQGRKKSDFSWNAEDHKAAHIQPKDGETIEELYDRAKSFLNEIISKHRNDTVLFVGHGAMNKALIAAITAKKHESIRDMDNQHNTSINVFEIDEDKNHKVLRFNCIKHLIKS